MLNDSKDNKERYWPATLTKIVAFVIFIPLVILAVLILFLAWLIRGVPL